MIRRSFSSLSSLQLLLLALGAVTLAFLWGLHFQHQATSADEALAAKASERLNLAAIAGQNLRQLVDRAQVIGGALRGKAVALSDPVSTSGSLMPNAEFSRLTGLPLAQFFGSVIYSGSRDKSLDALPGKRIDAALAGFLASQGASGLAPVSHADYAPLQRLMEPR